MIKSVGGQVNGEEPKWVLDYNEYRNQKQKEREFLIFIRKLIKKLDKERNKG